jgi:methionyl-tRNA formyltransferase
MVLYNELEFLLKLILMGTGPFAVPSFEALRIDGHELVAVVTRPSVSTSGKKQPTESPVVAWASSHRLSIAAPSTVNEQPSIEWLRTLDADLMVVCDYGQILSREALSVTKLGGINLHGSLLPRHRGAAPVQWSILSGDTEAGISIIHMTPILDGGPVLLQQSTPIANNETSQQLEERLSQLGVASTLASIAMLSKKQSIEECIGLGFVQDKTKTTKAPRLAKQDGELNANYPVRCLDRLVRGLRPWPGTFMNVQLPDKSLRVIVEDATPIECEVPQSIGKPGDLLYGSRLNDLLSGLPSPTQAMLCLVAIDGLLNLRTVQPAGKRPMAAEEFLRGYSRYASMHVQGEAGVHPLLNQMMKQ